MLPLLLMVLRCHMVCKEKCKILVDILKKALKSFLLLHWHSTNLEHVNIIDNFQFDSLCCFPKKISVSFY